METRELVCKGVRILGIAHVPVRKPKTDTSKYLKYGKYDPAHSEQRRKEIWDKIHAQEAAIKEQVVRRKAMESARYTEIEKTPTSTTTKTYVGPKAVEQKVFEKVITTIWNKDLTSYKKIQEKRSNLVTENV